ncbi:Eukaryotic translation initiation factor 4 gamma, 1a [Balamuthia mandrillaris]
MPTMTKAQWQSGWWRDSDGERVRLPHPGPVRYENSFYYQSDSYAWASGHKRFQCMQCHNAIEPNSLYSLANLVVDDCMDEWVKYYGPIVGDWTETVHLGCLHHKKTEEDVLVKQKQIPHEMIGWGELPRAERERILQLTGIPVTKDLLKQTVPVFRGMRCIFVGIFEGNSKGTLASAIEARGGLVLAAVNKSNKPTHIVLGKDGVTSHGQKAGRSSKKYKDAMKARPKPQVVDPAFIRAAIAKGSNIFEQEEKEEEEEEKKEEEEEEEKEEEEEVEEEKVDTGSSKKRKRSARGGEPGNNGKQKARSTTKRSKTATTGKSKYKRATLESKKRAELQALCKKHSLRANVSNVQMITALLALDS